MPLPVVAFCTYRTSLGEWRGVDYDAHDFIDAIKDRNINGHSWLRVRGQNHRFDNSNRQQVVRWFAQMAADYLTASGPESPYVLVPFPSSKADRAFAGVNRTTTLAEAIVAEYGHRTTVCDALRFDQPLPSANEQGGTREAQTLYEHLCVVSSVSGRRIVIVDDVLTSGGHLRAGTAKLLIDGRASAVLLAICAGRADQMEVPDPFAIRDEVVDDFVPRPARR